MQEFKSTDERLEELNHMKTRNAETALKLYDICMSEKNYGVVTFDKAIESIYGSLRIFKKHQIKEFKDMIESAFDKASDFADQIDDSRPMMKVRDTVPAITKDEKIEIIGFKIKTPGDLEYENRNMQYRIKQTSGWVNGGIKSVDSCGSSGMIKEEIAKRNSDNLKTVIGSLQAMLPEFTHVGNPDKEAIRKTIIDEYDAGLIGKRERDNRLSDLS